MQYIKLKEKLSKFIIFSLSDIKKIEPNFHRARLNEWQKKAYIKKIRRSYYMFSDQVINEAVLFLVANKIYFPSYISLEMAMSIYNLIPEAVYELTSVSTNKTNYFKTDIADFRYRSIRPELMFGYKLVKFNGCVYKIAEAEKAILDFLYINPHLKTKDDFSELRLNKEEFKLNINQEKLIKYLEVFANMSLKKRVNILLNYINLC
jgi:predicted transcriptional regulator of viral defense system